jgi:hypothetical protein
MPSPFDLRAALVNGVRQLGELASAEAVTLGNRDLRMKLELRFRVAFLHVNMDGLAGPPSFEKK